MLSKILAGVLLATVLGGAFYFKYASDKIDLLTQNNATLSANQKTLEEINSNNVSEMEALVAETKRIEQVYNDTLGEFQIIRMQRDELISKFARHDLQYLALMRPESVERIVNAATADAGRCFELISGSPKNQRELNAKNANDFNSECPWLYGE